MVCSATLHDSDKIRDKLLTTQQKYERVAEINCFGKRAANEVATHHPISRLNSNSSQPEEDKNQHQVFYSETLFMDHIT